MPAFAMSRSQSINATHVERRYFLSFSVDLECMCVVHRLIFPADGIPGSGGIDGDLSAASSTESDALLGLGEYQDLRFTAHIYSHGLPMHHVPVSTSSCPEVGNVPIAASTGTIGDHSPSSRAPRNGETGEKESKYAASRQQTGGSKCLVWDEVLCFPAKVSDLSRNARLVLTAWAPDGAPFGGTSLLLFDEKGALKMGRQKLVFFAGDGSRRTGP